MIRIRRGPDSTQLNTAAIGTITTASVITCAILLPDFDPIDTGPVLKFMCPAAGLVDRPAHLALETVPRTPEAACNRHLIQTFDCAFGKEGLHVGKDLLVDDICCYSAASTNPPPFS